MTPECPSGVFEYFERTLNRWRIATEELQPVLRAPECTRLRVELDHIRTIAEEALARSTKLDYADIADMSLRNLQPIEMQVRSAYAQHTDVQQRLLSYLALCRELMHRLRALPVPPEGHLGFREHVLKAFKFLLEERGFNVSKSTPSEMEFRSTAIRLHLQYAPQCPMLMVEIAPLEPRAEALSLTLDDIAYSAGHNIMFEYDQFDLMTPAGLSEFISAASHFIREYARDILTGAPEAITKWRQIAECREKAYVAMVEESENDTA